MDGDNFIPVNCPWWGGLTVNQNVVGSSPATGASLIWG